jgi:transposase
VPLSRDGARFPLVPTLRATLGVKGHRPRVGTWDGEDQVYCFAALDLVSGRLTTRLLDSPARVKAVTGRSQGRRLQAAFAAHLRDVARADPGARHPRVVVVIDNAPWHRGAAIRRVLAEQPHLALYRLPSDSPHRNVVERLWRVWRRRATHDRLFETMAALRRAPRASLCYDQTLRHKVRSLIRAPQNVAPSAAA